MATIVRLPQSVMRAPLAAPHDVSSLPAPAGMCNTHTHTHTHTHRHARTHARTHARAHTHRQTDTHTQRQRQRILTGLDTKGGDMPKHRRIAAVRQTCLGDNRSVIHCTGGATVRRGSAGALRTTVRDRERERERETERQRERETDRRTDRQTDMCHRGLLSRTAERQAEAERQREVG